MVAPPDEGKPQVRRGGKSELQRAGWSVIRTAPREMDAYFTGGKESATENIPPCGIAITLIPKGKGEKARQELTSTPSDWGS